MNKRWKVFGAGLGAVLGLAAASSADRGNIRIDQVNANAFPSLALYASAEDSGGNPVTDLKEDAWDVAVDGVPLRVKKNVTPFQFSRENLALVVIVAASGIMKGRPLESEKAAVSALAAKLLPQDQMAVLAYGDRVENVLGFSAKPEERRPKLMKLGTLGDSVMLYDALWQGLELLSPKNPLDLPVRKGILIISDGRDSGSTCTRAEVLERIKRSNIPVYGVGFTLLSERGLPELKSIAEASGGVYGYTPMDTALTGNFEKILAQIQKGYVVAFKARGVPGDGQVHQLTLTVKIGGKTSAFTKGFTAQGRPRTWLELAILALLVFLVLGLAAGSVYWYFFFPLRGYKRKCPKCKRVLKDEWEECMFCKYAPLYAKTVLKSKH